MKYLDFSSLYASAMVQALPTGEIGVCDNLVYTRSSFNTEKTSGDIDQFTDYQNEKKNLTDKVDYVIDGEILDWYLDNGASFTGDEVR